MSEQQNLEAVRSRGCSLVALGVGQKTRRRRSSVTSSHQSFPVVQLS